MSKFSWHNFVGIPQKRYSILLIVRVLCCADRFSHGRLFVTLWTVARQAPLSMGFSRQECWSALPCPPPGDLLAQGSSPHLLCLLHWQVGSLPLLAPPRRLPHCSYHKHKMSLCPITVDVNCDHQVKVISARFLHYNVTVFPFLISKCPVVKYFETMWISCFSWDFNSVS